MTPVLLGSAQNSRWNQECVITSAATSSSVTIAAISWNHRTRRCFGVSGFMRQAADGFRRSFSSFHSSSRLSSAPSVPSGQQRHADPFLMPALRRTARSGRQQRASGPAPRAVRSGRPRQRKGSRPRPGPAIPTSTAGVPVSTATVPRVNPMLARLRTPDNDTTGRPKLYPKAKPYEGRI